MAQPGSAEKHQFGTFGGVFAPSILTIFGLIMFMRASFVVGNAGVPQTLLILTICCGITLLTALSISAISTNTPVGGGGAYFLISRVLGPGFGTAIGIALFVAQALSVPFYILGFVEALTTVLRVRQYYFAISLVTLVVLFVVAWVGADWALKCQYAILLVLGLAITAFMVGMALRFDATLLQQNMSSNYALGRNRWSMFAIYFPAVTGIMAGVNMSGDLKEPARSIPRGILAAIALSFVVYGVQAVLTGGLAPAATLQAQPFQLLVDNAWLGLGFIVVAGVFAATISSAIGSYLGAPRVLQAVARDRVLPSLTVFGKGAAKGDEPRQALLLTFGIGLLMLLFVGRGDSGEGLNLVASVVTMVFLYTYGMTNVAAFVESFGNNPSFRPRFRFYHWLTALAGALACLATAFLINPAAAAAAFAIILSLFLIARKREMSATYGDARRGFVFARVRNNLCQLAGMPVHAKNWRPTILVFSGSPHARLSLITYARWMGVQSGIVSVVSVLVGNLDDLQEERRQESDRLQKFVADNDLDVFPETIVMEDFDRDLTVFLQAHSLGPIKPNIVLFGWAREPDRLAPYFSHLAVVRSLGMSLVIVIDHGQMMTASQKRVDCWWRGRENGSLMVILAHLMRQNREWRRTRLRIVRLVNDEQEVDSARDELEGLIGAARLTAEVFVPVSSKPFPEVFREHSQDASLILMGLSPPPPEKCREFHAATEAMLQDMPTTLLISSSGDADLLA